MTAGQVDVLSSGPGENYPLEFTVHEGKLTVEEERGGWWRVRLWGDLTVALNG